MAFVSRNYYELLEVTPTATSEEISLAYRAVRKSWRPDSIALYPLYSPEETAAIRSLLEEAHTVLSDPARRVDYDRYLRFTSRKLGPYSTWEEFWEAAHLEPSEPNLSDLPVVEESSDGRAASPTASEPALRAVVEAVAARSAPSPDGSAARSGPAPVPVASSGALTAGMPRARTPSPVPPAVTPPPPAHRPPMRPASPSELGPPVAEGSPARDAGGVRPQSGHLGRGLEAGGPTAVSARDPASATQSLPSMRSAPPSPEQPRISTDSIEARVAQSRPSPLRPESGAGAAQSDAAPAPAGRTPAPASVPVSPDNRAAAARSAPMPTTAQAPAPPEAAAEQRVDGGTSTGGWSRSYAAGLKPTRPLPEMPVPRDLLEQLEAQQGMGGAYLKAIREYKGISLNDIAAHTKVQTTYLKYLEEERFADLPPAVYVEGFVNQVARLLKLEVKRTVSGYMRRYYEIVSASGNGLDGF